MARVLLSSVGRCSDRLASYDFAVGTLVAVFRSVHASFFFLRRRLLSAWSMGFGVCRIASPSDVGQSAGTDLAAACWHGLRFHDIRFDSIDCDSQELSVPDRDV